MAKGTGVSSALNWEILRFGKKKKKNSHHRQHDRAWENGILIYY